MKAKFFSIVLIFLLLVGFAQAADVFNVGTIQRVNGESPSSGNYIIAFEDYFHITYKWVFTMADSANAYHSKPFYIGNCNVDDGYMYAVQDDLGDVDFIFHFSPDDRNTWQTLSATGLNALSSTAKVDTIGHEDGANDILFHNARWCVIECADGGDVDGGTNNNEITIILKLKKSELGPVDGNGNLIRVARMASTYNTAP